MSPESPETTELVNKREVAEQLLDAGLDKATVAAALRMPIKAVEAISTFRSTTTLTVQDQELAEAMRNLIWMAYEEAVYTIQMGAPQDRMALVKLLVARGTSLVGAETNTRFDEMRLTFEKMMTGIRDGQTEFELPEDDDVEPFATLGDPYDTD